MKPVVSVPAPASVLLAAPCNQRGHNPDDCDPSCSLYAPACSERMTSVILNTGASITDGWALARNGAITLDSCSVSISAAGEVTNMPEPMSAALLAAGLLLSLRMRRR